MVNTTLHIGGWSSRCGNCGKSCNPSSETHDVILGYGPENGTPGCGVRWTEMDSDYGTDVSHMRSDLPQVGVLFAKRTQPTESTDHEVNGAST